MFEGYLAFYLNKYLGQYVEGIDQKQFRVSIYKGDVVLNNLRLKPDALAALDLPVTVRAGLLGSLTLKVPWSSLGTVPVEAKIDRLYLLASPKTEEERGKGVRKESDLEPCFQLSKRQRVATQEERWVAELEAAQEAQDKAEAASQGDQGGGGGGVGGMLKAVIDTVIGNLQLSISNVHIRYEDAVTNPNHPFACGITLDRISGYTIDELGREAFVTNNPLQMLRKALTLRRIAVYFDTDSEFWAPGAAWRDLAPHDWDDWFLPGVSAGRQERGGTARSRQYVLKPVDGQARYTRRGAGVQAKEDEPALELDFQLNDVAVCLTRPQYQSYHLLLAEVSSFSARLPYSGYRPRLRPAAGEQARLWWRYALKAVQQQLAARKLTWTQAVRFARMRKEYVPAYAEHLRQLAAGQTPQRIERLPAPVVEMDRQLPEQTILMFRRLAHAKVQREKRRAAKEAAAAGKTGGGGWMDWLRGGGGGGGKMASPRTSQSAAEEAPELTPEEYGRLVELVEQQEQGMRLGPETPYTLLTRIGARVSSASALLLAADGSRVLRGGLEAIHLTLDRFPETLRMQLGVGGMGLECPEGTLIRTGGQLHRLVSATDLTAEMPGPAGAAAEAAQRALAVQFVQKPQDGSADALLDVVLTPSYVVYSATAVDRVVQFFRTPQELDLSSLSAQATTQLERARRLAAQYAAAALQSRPKLKLHLELDAPKVAIPTADAKGRATLALDFGRFIIETDPDTPAKLPAEEAALYECVRLEVSDVAAYVADGDFDWQAEQGGEGGKPGQLIPLLNRTGMSIALQAARFADPKYPVVRLQPSIPVLHFYLSPGRMGRLLRVVRAALPASEEQQAGGTAGPPTSAARPATAGAAGQELWRQHAEYEGAVKVLTWGGIGYASASWCPRYGVLYQGKLYLYESSAPGAKLAATEAVWAADRRVVRVPPENIGGAEHVVALCPDKLDLTRLAENTSCLVLRLESEEAVDAWYRQLQASQAAMDRLAGEEAALLPPDWEEASSTISGTDADEAALTAAQGPPPGAQAAEAGQVPTTVLQMDAQLGELAIFCGGREPSPWWPPEDQDDLQPTTPPAAATPPAPPSTPPPPGAAATEGSPFCSSLPSAGAEFVNVDGEVALIVVRAAGGNCRFTYGAPGMTVHTALGSLEIEDLLVGRRCTRNRFLASSVPGVEPVGEDVFFDADDRLASGSSGALTPRSNLRTSAGSSPDAGSGGLRGPPPAGPTASSKDLAEFTFKLRQPGGPEWEGVDSSLDVQLSSLYFYCNRPTVAAIIAMGVDVGAAASAAFGGSEEAVGTAAGAGPAAAGDGKAAEAAGEGGEGQQEGCQVEGEPAAVGQAGAIAQGVQPTEERVEQVQLVRSGSSASAAGDRSTFRLTASLGTLQVRLNYEGAGCATLSQASVDAFTFGLDVKPDSSMVITSTLGNVRALDCTLPEDHPYHQACGLRAGSDASLVSLEFCSYPPSYRHPKVPEGLQYYTLQAQLSELQLVFLYRFLSENLTYISTMLAMRPPPLEFGPSPGAAPADSTTAASAAPEAGAPGTPAASSAAGGQAGSGAGSAASTQTAVQAATSTAQSPVQPFVLLMDVRASAPNIRLPRSSDSMDAIEADLGQLTLQTAGIVPQVGGPKDANGWPLLVEAVDLCFSGVGCTVVQAGRRGGNLFQNAESGWRLHWRRPLQQELRGEQPTFDMSLAIPFLKASLTDAEYQLCTSVASDNFSEEPELPRGAAWLNDHYQAILLEQQQELARQHLEALARQQAQQAQQAALPAPAAEAGKAAPASQDTSPTSVRVVVSLGEIELELQRHLEGLPQAQPLARFTLGDLWVAFRNSAQGSMWVSLNLPRVEARDLRPEVPPEQTLVISSGHKASFLMLDWAASAGMAHQALAMTLQKPLLVAELSFLLAVTQFVVPTFAFVKSRPIPFVTHDLALTAGAAHKADGDLFLCPTVRLLADTPLPVGARGMEADAGSDVAAAAAAAGAGGGSGDGGLVYEYDGRGHRLVLPDKGHLDEPLPLILIGPGRTLRLRNVRLVNAASLAVCLQLAPGARLLASPDDGVQLLQSAEEDAELSRQLAGSPPSPAASLLSRRTPPTSPQRLTSLQREPGSPRSADLQPVAASQAFATAAAQPQPAAAQQQQGSTMEIVLSAVGVGLQFVHLDSGGSGSGVRSLPGTRPGSGLSSQHASAADLSRAASQQLVAGPSQAALAAAAGQQQAGQLPPKAVQLLAAYLDIRADYRIEGPVQSGRVEVQGLRVETRFISDVAARLAQRDQQDIAHKRKMSGRREGTVLDPCRLALEFKLADLGTGGGDSTAAASVTDIKLEASDLRLTLSPDVLELGTRLAASVLEPLMQPQPDQPLASCNQFERVWSFDPAEWLAEHQPGGQLAVSLAVTGAEGGVTVWRAKAPTGYAVTGDVVMPGATQPTFEVLAVAANSGLAAYPTGYTRVWSGAGGAIWRPLPPPGYIAAGDLFSTDPDREPELSAMVCLHEGTVVECSPGERLSLPPQLPHTPAASALVAAAVPRVDLWCNDNSLGTFYAGTASLPFPEQSFDLRSPLGVTPAALLAIGAAEEVAWAAPKQQLAEAAAAAGASPAEASRPQDVQQPAAQQAQQQQPGKVASLRKQKDAGEMFRRFESSRRHLQTESAARLVTPSVVDFRRIWAWDGNGDGSGPGISIWRPLPPPGYVTLGDCLERGWDPPVSACVVQDTDGEASGPGAAQPLVKAPRGFEPVWEDTTSYADARLVLWRPVPFPGYVAMGCVATLGTDPPPRSCVKCLRADAAARADPARTPLWTIRREARTMPPLSAWTVDEKLHTFVAAPTDSPAGPPADVWRLRQPAAEQQAEAVQQASGGVNVVVKAGQASVQVQDAFHVPLLELCLGSVEAGVRGPSRQVAQAYLGFKMGVWSYNGAVKHWEPVVEPWDVIAQCAANHGTRMSSGIEPGVAVSIKSSNDCVYTTLAFSALHSILAAYSDWQQLHDAASGGRAMRALLAAGEASAMHVVVENRLGVEAAMELDFGDHLNLVKLPSGSATPVVKPLPSFPLREGDAVVSADALPHTLLLLDIQQAALSGLLAGHGASSSSTDAGGDEGSSAAHDSQASQLYCTVRLESSKAAGKPLPSAGAAGVPGSPGRPSPASTQRGMQGSSAHGSPTAPLRTRALALGSGGVVTWQERLVLALPMRPGAGEQTLVFEVWDAAARGGRGASLGCGRLAVPVRSLQHREEHTAELSWETPAAPAGGSGSGAEAGSSPAKTQEQQQGSVRLQLSYMLQKQWSFAKSGAGPAVPDSWGADASTAGQRALSLASHPGSWAVVPAFGQQKGGSGGVAGGASSGAAGASTASLIPLKIGGEGLVVESSVAHGTRRELLRALCQLVNTTELTLEAALIEVEDSDWHMVAARSGSVSAAVSVDSVEEDVFENERFARGGALSGQGAAWSASNLGASDPRQFQYALHETDSFPKVDPPAGWEWESGWQVDHGPATDADGWAYAPDFKALHFPPPPGAHKPGSADFVRRRRWVRRRRREGRPAFPAAAAAASAAGRALGAAAALGQHIIAGPLGKHEDQLVVKQRQVLGRAAPGEALPLPLGWSAPGRQLQLRPVLPVRGAAGAADQQAQQEQGAEQTAEGQQPAEEEGELQAVHDWSHGTSGGQHTVKLDCLDEGITRLVCCPSLGATQAMGSASELQVNDLWFSLAVESEVLAGSKGAKPLTDWRVVVSAPLRLTNQLPVGGSLLVWEQQPGAGRELVGRQTVQVASGATVPIHTADMRRAVSFTFYPEGYDWVEPQPTVLSEGHAGRGLGRQQLPDRFRLARPAATGAPVEVFIHRTIEFGSWLLNAKEELDPGAVVAMGVPLSVSLLAPLWVVNATPLAVDAVIVPLDTPPLQAQQSGKAGGLVPRRRASEGFRPDALRVVPTDDRDPMQRGEYRGRRFLAPGSLELLSYPLPSYLLTSASQQQLAAGAPASSAAAAEAAQRQRQQQRQQYGIRLRVAGSGWTPPLALDPGELAAGAAAAAGGGGQGQAPQTEGLANGRGPVLIRAHASRDGAVHEVVMRLEVTQYGTSQMLRLEPHIVVSNRTPVPLQLLQTRLALASPPPLVTAASSRGQQPRPQGAVVAEGGHSFSSVASSGFFTSPLWTGGPPLVRPSRSAASAPALLGAAAGPAAVGAAASARWERASTAIPSGASPLVQLTAASFRQQQQQGGLLDLPAGSAAVPLPLGANLPNHTLSFRCMPAAVGASGAAAAADQQPLWSRPVTIRNGVETQLHVVIPVPPPEEEPGSSGSGDAAHLTAGTAGAAALSAGARGGACAGVAILRLSVHRRGPGGMHVVLESVQADPPYLLENRTPFPLRYRQAYVRGALLHTLEPYSAAGYVWEFSMYDTPQELELREGQAQGVAYALGAPDEQSGEPAAAAAARARPLPLSVAPHQCSVRVSYWEQVIQGPEGVAPIGGDGSGGVLGRGGIDRVLAIAPGHEPLLSAGATLAGPTRSSYLTLAFELPGLEVSLVDHKARELLLLSAAELKASLVLGSNPASAYKSVRLSVQRLQLDDMLPGTPFPVVLAPSLQQQQQQAATGGGAAGQPILAVTWTSVAGGARGRSYLPLILVRWPIAVQLAISESLVWSVNDLYQRLQRVLEAPGEGGAAAGGGAVAAADVPVRIRLLAVDQLSTQISFQGDPFSRPRDMAGGLLSSVIDLANFQAAPISLAGIQESNINMLQSAFSASIMQHVRSQLFYVALSLMRNFGLIGGTSRALGALSAALAKLAAGPAQAAGREVDKPEAKRAISDVGEGMLEGVGSIGHSVLRGFKGLVSQPVQGAKKQGAVGAVKGIGKGLLGAVASPVSGVLDALSATAEGFDATFGKPKEQLLVMERRRPPRLVSGDGKLLPLVRGGSTKQSRIEEIGQALLRNTLLAAPDGLRRMQQGGVTESYEEHFVLPDGRVALLTNAGLLLVHAPGFAQLDGAAEIGAIAVSDVPPGQLQWSVRWDDVLAFELRFSREGHYPDRLVVHRKGTPGWQEEESLAHQIKCFEGTPQASQIKLVADKVLRKYYLDPLRRNRMWSQRHDARAGLPSDTPLEQLPLTMPSLDFALTWHTNPRKSPVVSFWRPLPPAGYRAVGDVMSLGLEPPSAPVPCFRDDVGLRIGASQRSGSDEPPVAMRPREFALVWRYNGKRPVTVWMPVSPPGYAALGAVVRGEPEVPATEDYLCIRSDMTATAQTFNSPLWSYDPSAALLAAAAGTSGSSRGAPLPLPPHHPETWKVSVWQVDNRLGTFVAVRSLQAPPPGVARAVRCIEERAASRQAAQGKQPGQQGLA